MPCPNKQKPSQQIDGAYMTIIRPPAAEIRNRVCIGLLFGAILVAAWSTLDVPYLAIMAFVKAKYIYHMALDDKTISLNGVEILIPNGWIFSKNESEKADDKIIVYLEKDVFLNGRRSHTLAFIRAIPDGSLPVFLSGNGKSFNYFNGICTNNGEKVYKNVPVSGGFDNGNSEFVVFESINVIAGLEMNLVQLENGKYSNLYDRALLEEIASSVQINRQVSASDLPCEH